MSRILIGVATSVALVAVGTSAYLYNELHANDRHVQTSAAPQSAVVPTPHSPPTAEQAARNAEALRTIRASADEFLTGDPNGRAEWNAPTGVDFPTICGVTPDGRYFIKRTRYGRARYDEPNPGHGSVEFINAWVQMGCEKTSPVNQRYLIHDQIQEDHYKHTHEINTACLMEALHDTANGQKDKRFEDPHYCRSGQYERDQAAKAQTDTPPSEAADK